ncbi:MAG: endonuclease/exonuclease/phosphatase family protein [Planctomycetia bacterium]|nr:endonuclease/exonuclease/phosphatase family protein [Planctomycetia bacterium]
MNSDPRLIRRVPPFTAGRWLDAFAIAVLAGTIAGWCGRWYWLFDLASHFRSSWLLLAGAGLVACMRWPRPIAAACLVIAALGNVREMLPYWLSAESPAASATVGERAARDRDVVVIAMNVRRINDDPTAAIAYLRGRRPDVVAVLEVDEQWAEALDTLGDLFPHRIIRPRPDNFGLAVLARWPLDDQEIVVFSTTGFPSIIATVRGPAGDFRFIATHPYPPFNAQATVALGEHLAGVADVAAASPLPCIVAGDLNATPWSLPFRTLVARSGLIDTALGRGVQATWNARYPIPRIPIDHILAPRGTRVLRREVGPDIGSDHFPVEAELILPAR